MTTWKSCLALGASVLAGSITVACGETGSPIQPSAASPTAVGAEPRHEVGVHESTAATFGPSLAAVRRATAAFHDPAVAAAAGYVFSNQCMGTAAGAAGIHVANPALVRDPAVDPEQPEILLYLPKPDGGLRLVGVEYIRFASLLNPDTGRIGPWISPLPWPANYQLLSSTPELFGQTFDGPMAGHSATMPWHWDLHVWVWAHNPDGMFAQWNPALQCPQ